MSLPVPEVQDFAWVAIGDVDGDRRPDIVVNSGGVLVFRQSSTGTFAAYDSFAVEGNGLGLADLDGDARDDAVVVQIRGGGSLEVLLAQPGGTLAPPVAYALSSLDGDVRYPGNPHVADFDGDGRLDVVLATDCCQGRRGTIDLFPGRGDGTLGAPISTDVSHSTVSSVVDMDGDGRLDLVGAHEESSSTVGHIIPYASGGRFGAARSVPLYGPTAPAFWPDEAQMTVGDVTGDRVPDLVLGVAASASVTSNLTVLAQLEGGAFSSPVVYSGADPTKVIATADVTGDGLDDVIALQAGGAAIRSQRSDGTLSPEIILQKRTYNAPTGIAVADLNGDGWKDIVTTELGAVLIFYNKPL